MDLLFIFPGLELRLYGGCYVRWKDKRSRRQDSKTEVEHSAEEIYFDDTFILWGHGTVVVRTRYLMYQCHNDIKIGTV